MFKLTFLRNNFVLFGQKHATSLSDERCWVRISQSQAFIYRLSQSGSIFYEPSKPARHIDCVWHFVKSNLTSILFDKFKKTQKCNCISNLLNYFLLSLYVVYCCLKLNCRQNNNASISFITKRTFISSTHIVILRRSLCFEKNTWTGMFLLSSSPLLTIL